MCHRYAWQRRRRSEGARNERPAAPSLRAFDRRVCDQNSNEDAFVTPTAIPEPSPLYKVRVFDWISV